METRREGSWDRTNSAPGDWRGGRIFFPDGDPVQFSMTPSLQAGIHIQYLVGFSSYMTLGRSQKFEDQHGKSGL